MHLMQLPKASQGAYHVAAYTQYVCSLNVARDAGEFKSQSLMESSQLPVRNVFLLTTFQFTQYTCVVTCK